MSARIASRLAVISLVVAASFLGAGPARSAAPVKKPSPYATPNATAAAPFTEDLEGAKLNWGAGRLDVSGQGAPGDRGPVSYRRKLAERAAIADAYRRLSSTLELIRVDTNTRVKDLAVTDDALRTRLNDYVKSAKVLETNFWPDGTAEVVLDVQLRGEASLAALVAGTTSASAPPDGSPAPSPSPTATPTPVPSKEIVTSPVPIHAGYSAVVVDAHGLGAEPALLPNVRDHGGKLIDLDTDAPRAIIKYFKEGAELDNAAGLNPLVVRAVHTQGPLKADLVLSSEASETLKDALKDKKLVAGTPLLVRL